MSIHSCGQPGVRLAGSLCAVLLLSLFASGIARADVCRVATTGINSNDGSTWALPMDLPTALGTASCTEVWVAQGVYKPGSTRTDSFNIRPDVAVYGGFAGGEASREARDPAAHVTVLSGDIDNNDSNTDGNHIDETSADIVGDNSYHVVYMDGTTTAGNITASTVLDGFVITGGDANDAAYPKGGGGLFCNAVASSPGDDYECSPSLSNLVFSGNSAARGGAMYNYGALGNSSPTLSNITFSGNSAGNGGAMYNDGDHGNSSPTLGNVTFSGNSALGWGGAMFNNSDSSPSLSNVTFSGNSANYGGALYNYNVQATIPASLSNVILWGDSAFIEGPEIINGAILRPNIDHSVIQGSGGSGAGWNNGLGTDGGGNIDADPRLGPLGKHGGLTETMLLGAGSSAIDSGNPVTCISAPVNGVDQRGVFRFENNSILCDIGAVEMKLVTDRIFANGFEP